MLSFGLGTAATHSKYNSTLNIEVSDALKLWNKKK